MTYLLIPLDCSLTKQRIQKLVRTHVLNIDDICRIPRELTRERTRFM